MKEYLQSRIYGLSYYLEMFISVILTLIIIVLSGQMFFDLFDISYLLSGEDVIQVFLERAMNLAVGVELIKMLCKHTPGTVVEVLLFAIARQVIFAHASVVETLAGVICIVILFATRKYLFTARDEVTKITLRGSQTVKNANILAKIHIPMEDGPLLRDAMEKRIAEEELSRAVGTCIDYHNFALCIASIHDDLITRVDVIKSH